MNPFFIAIMQKLQDMRESYSLHLGRWVGKLVGWSAVTLVDESAGFTSSVGTGGKQDSRVAGTSSSR
jgi:hypothetical protein